jgi:hypothetical protein
MDLLKASAIFFLFNFIIFMIIDVCISILLWNKLWVQNMFILKRCNVSPVTRRCYDNVMLLSDKTGIISMNVSTYK